MRSVADRYRDLFPAILTAREVRQVTQDDGRIEWTPFYGWIELTPAAQQGYAVQPGARSGTPTLNWARHVRDSLVSVGVPVWIRHRDEGDGALHFEFDAPEPFAVVPPLPESGSGSGSGGDCLRPACCPVGTCLSDTLCLDITNVVGMACLEGRLPLAYNWATSSWQFHPPGLVCGGDVRIEVTCSEDDPSVLVLDIDLPGATIDGNPFTLTDCTLPWSAENVEITGSRGEGFVNLSLTDGACDDCDETITGSGNLCIGPDITIIVNGPVSFPGAVPVEVVTQVCPVFADVELGGTVGPEGPAGADGTPGAPGAEGPPGPNLVDTNTATDLTGYLTGDGATVGVTLTIPGSDVSGAVALATTVTTNANLTGPITSVGNATSIASQTGTGTTFAMSASPTFTGTPAAPTAAPGTNTTQIATTAFVTAAVAAGSAVAVVDAGGDTTCWVMLATSQTGAQSPATDSGITYNATTDTLALVGLTASTAPVFTVDTAMTAGPAPALILDHKNTGGTPATGFGAQILFRAESTTTESRDVGEINGVWATATDASRKGRLDFWVYGSAGNIEAMRVERMTGGPGVGFLGASASERLASPDAGTALVTFGLASGTPTFAGANVTGTVANATTAAVASTVSSANEATDTTCFPLFITASGTQSLQPKNNVNLTFNSSSGALGATSFVGNTAASTITGTTLAANVVTTSITTVGTLVGGNATAIVDAASDTAAGKIELAVQSEMETATDVARAVTPGRQHFHPGSSKGWVYFNGTGTLAVNASYNVTSVTDNGTGDYTVNWGTDFSSANYNVAISAGGTGVLGGYPKASPLTAGTTSLVTLNTSFLVIDASAVFVNSFGDHA